MTVQHHTHRPPEKKKTYVRDRHKPPPPFVARERLPGEAPPGQIDLMQAPTYKPPAWVAPIR